ncbi:MAG: stage II sporulation protein M [Muribaculaceae bacterium]|nr:stage II sporulation protein M [Muribaculaceae bacterium]
MKTLNYRCRLYFIGLSVIYIIAFIIGVFYGREDYQIFKTIEFDILVPELQMEDSFEIFISILKNNLTVALLFFLSALFSLGILPIPLMFYNGFIFGNVWGCSTKFLCIKDILSASLPHSLEFMGLIIFGVAGFQISYEHLINKQKPSYTFISRLLISGILIITVNALLESYISIRY